MTGNVRKVALGALRQIQQHRGPARKLPGIPDIRCIYSRRNDPSEGDFQEAEDVQMGRTHLLGQEDPKQFPEFPGVPTPGGVRCWADTKHRESEVILRNQMTWVLVAQLFHSSS